MRSTVAPEHRASWTDRVFGAQRRKLGDRRNWLLAALRHVDKKRPLQLSGDALKLIQRFRAVHEQHIGASFTETPASPNGLIQAMRSSCIRPGDNDSLAAAGGDRHSDFSYRPISGRTSGKRVCG